MTTITIRITFISIFAFFMFLARSKTSNMETSLITSMNKTYETKYMMAGKNTPNPSTDLPLLIAVVISKTNHCMNRNDNASNPNAKSILHHFLRCANSVGFFLITNMKSMKNIMVTMIDMTSNPAFIGISTLGIVARVKAYPATIKTENTARAINTRDNTLRETSKVICVGSL